jgi:acyl-coenzyme A thioesterase PaaI-like protein
MRGRLTSTAREVLSSASSTSRRSIRRVRATPENLRRLWARLAPVPFGTVIFSRLFGWVVPYSGTVRPHILELAPGRARISFNDRRRVRNHLASVHAIALANLGEMATGLALGFGLAADQRSIIVRLSVAYLKKARGTVTATCDAPPLSLAKTKDYEVVCLLTNEAGELVARATATWRVGPVGA